MAGKIGLNAPDPEIGAITLVYAALSPLDADAQVRVVEYVMAKLGISNRSGASDGHGPDRIRDTDAQSSVTSHASIRTGDEVPDSSDGVNAIAQKWMARNNLSAGLLSPIYSLGSEEIDLIAKSIPGKSKRERMRNVLLLKCIAEYLGSGAARVSHEQLKETCLHYDAFDSPNFAAHLKSFASEVSGTKQSGYTLTQRGLAAATELIAQIANAKE